MPGTVGCSTSQHKTNNYTRTDMEMEEGTSTSENATLLDYQRRCLGASTKILGERSNLRNQAKTIIHIPNFQSAETRRLVQASHRSFSSKQVHSLSKIQNANCRKIKIQPSCSKFLHYSGHLRRISPLPSPSQISTIRSILNEWQSILLQSHAIRPKHRPADIHPVVKVSSIDPTRNGNQMQRIHRRLDFLGHFGHSTKSLNRDSCRHASQAWVQDKQIQVYPCPEEENRLLRNSMEWSDWYATPYSGQNRQSLEPSVEIHEEQHLHEASVPTTAGSHELHSTPAPPRTPPFLQSSPSSPSLSERSSSGFSGFSSGDSVVAKLTQDRNTCPLSRPSSRVGGLDRLLRKGMGGGDINRTYTVELLASSHEARPHNRIGSNCSTEKSPESSSSSPFLSFGEIRQSSDMCSDQQTRFHQIQQPPQNRLRAGRINSTSTNPSESSTHSGKTQRLGGPIVEGHANPNRVESDETMFQETRRQVRNNGDRFVRPPREPSTGEIRVQVSTSESSTSGFTDCRLDSMENHLPVPASRNNAGSDNQAENVPRKRSTHNSIPPTATWWAELATRASSAEIELEIGQLTLSGWVWLKNYNSPNFLAWNF